MKQVWKNSLLARSGSVLAEIWEASWVFHWLVGAGSFQETRYFGQSWILRVIRYIGKILLLPAFWLGKVIRSWTGQSKAQKAVNTVLQDFQLQPISLVAIAAIAMLLTNTITRFIIGAPPSGRGLLIRLVLILIGIPFLRVKTSWQTILKHSWAFQALRQLFVE